VIAGEYDGAKGPARTFTPITMLDVNLRANGTLPVTLEVAHNAMAIVTTGRVRANGRTARAGELVLFANDGGRVEIVADEDAHVLVLAGEPIDEPIVQHGPFVMNTREEIAQAFYDFEEGKFGEIPQ
jgi:hypothetical protein